MKTIIQLILMFLFLSIFCGGMAKCSIDCEQSGGVLINTVTGLTCIEAKVIK